MTAQILQFPPIKSRRREWSEVSLDKLLRDIKNLPPLEKLHGKPKGAK